MSIIKGKEFHKRKSGIRAVGALEWGSHICQFYESRKDLLDVLIPFFKAGLRARELCVWVTSGPVTCEDAVKALEKAVPGFDRYRQRGQIEVIADDRWHARGGKSGRSIVSRLDKAVALGFAGLRLASCAVPEKKGRTGYVCYGLDTITRNTVIALFSYPRSTFDTPGLMDVVNSHRCALVRKGRTWEVLDNSQAHSTRDALKRSEEKLQSLFVNMSEGFAYHRIVLDDAGKPCDYVFLEVNRAFEKLTGLKAKNILGKRVREVLPGIEKDPTDWIGKYGRVALSGNPTGFESYAEPLKKWYSVSAFSPHKGYFAVTISDATERKQAEAALRESELQFRTLADSIPNLAWSANSDGYITWYNKRWYDYTGTTPEQMEGWGWQSVHDPVMLPQVLERWKQSIATGLPFDMEFPLRGADGVFRLFLTRVLPFKDAGGKILRWFGTNTDVTERRKSEEAVRLSEEKFALAFANNPAAIALTRLDDGLFLDVNDTWIALMGYGREEAIGNTAKKLPIWPSPEDRARFVAELQEKESLRGWEQEFRRKTGELFVVQLSAQILLVRGEKLVLSTLVDVTERKRAEEALERSMRRFELLATTSGELLRSADPEKAVDSLCRKVLEHLDCDMFFNYLVDDVRGKLHLNSWAGIAGEDARRIEWLDLGQAVCGCVARDGRRIVAEKIASTVDERTNLVKGYGVKAYACHPLLQPGGKVLGTLSFGTKKRETFSDEDLSLMKAVTDQVAVAMIRIRDEQALRRANNELEMRIQERTAELARANGDLQEEIVVRKQAVDGLARLNRLYSVLSKVNEAIVRMSDPEALYAEVCRIAVEDGLFKMAWIGLIEPDTQEIRPVVSHGDAGGYLAEVRITATDDPEGRGPTGRAAFEGTYSLCSDIERDARMRPWRDKALGQGFRSSAAFPLLSAGAVIGALTVYSAEPQVFSDGETALFSSLVDDISFALDTMALRRRRTMAEEALQKASAYNRSLLEASLDPLVTISADGKITDVNLATENVTGYSRTELVGTDFSDYFTQPERAKAGYQQVFREGSVKDYELEIRHRDGHLTPVLYNAALYRDEAGQVLGVFAAARDITERKKAEEIVKLDETRNNSIIRISQYPAASLQELLDFALAEAIALSGSRLGYFYFYSEEKKEFTLHAWSREVMHQCTIANPQTVYQLESTGLWGEVVRQRKPILVNDFAAPHPLKKGYPDGHAPLSRFLSVPVMAKGRIVAVAGVANKPADYTDWDVRQLTLLIDAAWTIAERKIAEESLRGANAYNRSLLEASLDPLVAIAPDGKITDVNAATETVTGHTRKELIGTDFSDYFLDREKAKTGYQQVFREGSVKDYALEIVHKDGATTPVVYNASVYADETGKPAGVFAAARDITERRETERRNALTNELLKLYTRKFSRKEYLDVAVELIRGWSGCRHTGIRIADQDGNIPYESCTGYSPEFLSSEKTLSVKTDQCICTRVVNGSPESSELPDMTANGSFYCNETVRFVDGLTEEERGHYRHVCMRYGFLSLGVVPIRHGDRILGAIHIADERAGMLSRKKVEFIEQLAVIVGEALFRFGIEDEVRQLNRELEQRVNQRTAQLESANKELEAFAYSVSHDLRTPLRSIDGFSNAILEDYADRFDEMGKDYFLRIRAAAGKMGQLIDALLNLSRLTRGELNRTMVNLSRLAAGIADELKKSSATRDVEFTIEKDMIADGDPVMLRSVFENLLSNAWKFTGKREKAKIEVGVAEQDGRHVYFVRDNGAGFDMAYANKLFAAFNRLHSHNEFPGIGIGLATVQRIVHRHGGRIWAEGEVDKGATIYFTLD